MSDDDIPEGVDEETIERALRRVLQAEKAKLHMDNPMGINKELRQIIEDEVR